MAQDGVVVRFENVSFEHGPFKPIFDSVNFTVRRGSKITLMGQNGAGKSTLFELLTGQVKPEDGRVHITEGVSVAIAPQVVPRDELHLTLREFFERRFPHKVYDIEPKIDEVFEVVNLKLPHDRIVGTLSGGQQARVLLASALIQNPDLLLLDEPTNNLDKAGIEHLTQFLIDYKKTCIVISHDAAFLNSFTQGVLYLDIFTRKIEQYVGNYFDVVREISARLEKENRKNAQLAKEIQENKDKANFFAHKGGQMRLVAKKMRDRAEELEDEIVDVRREDKTIRPFTIPADMSVVGEFARITSYKVIRDGKSVTRKTNITLPRNTHLLLKGPNGIGKSTLLESIAKGTAEGTTVTPGVVIGYYRQDFGMLDFNETVYECLIKATPKKDEEKMRTTAAGFLLTADTMKTKVGDLSEGQKGLVAFARLVLQRPSLLILDEPTNHINFRHIPVIAEALREYQGAMILVSHVPDFVEKIRIDQTLDLES